LQAKISACSGNGLIKHLCHFFELFSNGTHHVLVIGHFDLLSGIWIAIDHDAKFDVVHQLADVAVQVINLLKDLKAKAIAQGKEEEVSYGKFEYWCKTNKAELKAALAEDKEGNSARNVVESVGSKADTEMAKYLSRASLDCEAMVQSSKTASRLGARRTRDLMPYAGRLEPLPD